MKKILAIVMAAMLVLPGMAAAAAAEDLELQTLELQANEEGKVILDAGKTNDGSTYILNNAEPDTKYNVMTTNATTFTTNDYRNGFFDNPTTTFTGNFDTRGSGNWQNLLYNNKPDSLGLWLVGTLTFADELKLEAVYLHADTQVDFLDINNNQLKRITLDNISSNSGSYYNLNGIKVKKIRFNNYGTSYISEMELFVTYDIDYIAASNVNIKSEITEATVNYKNPDSDFWRYNQIMLNDQIIIANTKDAIVKIDNLESNTEYTLTIRSYYLDGKYIDTIKKFRTTKDTTPPSKITSLKAVQNGNNIKLTFTPPADADFSHVQIQRGTAYLDKEFKDTTYIDTAPLENKLNSYSVRSVDKNGNVSMAATVSIMHDTGEVKSLKAVAPDYTNVQLQWQNTSRSDFEVVKIYRKSADAPMMRRVMNLFSANDGFTPLFETNGTTFKDLTVAPESEYTYKVTSVVAGNESAGVVTTIKTPKVSVVGSEIDPPPPPPQGQQEDPAAPYVIRWQQPTTGKILVKVGGVDYRLVDAADLSISIPKSDMKYTFMGAPDVQLVPIDDGGNAGVPTKPGGSNELGTIGSLPEELSAGNLLSLGIGLLKWVGPFVLLYLVFLIAAYLIGLLRNAIFPPKEKPKKTTKGTKGTSKGSTRGTSKRTTTVKKAPARSTVKQPAAKPEKVAAARAATRQANIAKVRPTAAKAVGAVDKPVKFARSTRRG